MEKIRDAVEKHLRGGYEYEIFLKRVKKLLIEASENSLENISVSEESGVGIRVLKDNRIGFAYTTSTEEENVKDVVAKASGRQASQRAYSPLRYSTPAEFTSPMKEPFTPPPRQPLLRKGETPQYPGSSELSEGSGIWIGTSWSGRWCLKAPHSLIPKPSPHADCRWCSSGRALRFFLKPSRTCFWEIPS